MEQEVVLGQPRTGPLQGIRGADFSAIFSGPIAGRMLADQGADVIKVEAFSGDMMRKGYPRSGGMASAFTSMNRNKRRPERQLTNAGGQSHCHQAHSVCRRRAGKFPAGGVDRLGLGYDAFRESQPKLVYASINGVGSVGPYANRRVYDAVIQAFQDLPLYVLMASLKWSTA